MDAAPDTPLSLVTFRPFRQGDADFFYRSWLDSFGLASPITVNVPKSVYYPAQRRLIADLARRSGSRIVVACLRDDPATLIGFLLAELGGERPVVHYVYVKGPFRKMGMARAMTAALGVDPARCAFTHWTGDCSWIKAKWPKAKYNPYLTRGE